MSLDSRADRRLRSIALVVLGIVGCVAQPASNRSAPVEPDPEIEVVRHNLETVTPVAKINFQPTDAPVPSGYTKDTGAAYVDGSSGWVRQDSLGGVRVPLNITTATRDRNRAGIDQRLDTLIHMQHPTSGAPPAAYEYAVSAGTYRIIVSVGDQSPYDSSHVIRVEGTAAISNFVGTAANEYRSATVTVAVTDGRLTVDAIGGTNTKLNYLEIGRVTNTPDAGSPDSSPDTQGLRPSIRSVAPANGATGIAPTSFVAADLNLPNVGGIDETTLTSTNVFLARTSDSTVVPAVLNTSGGGDVIVLQPSLPLAANTSYRFSVTDGLRDTTGARFTAFTSTFTTGSGPPPVPTSFEFEKVSLFAAASGRSFTSLAIGPDGRLYAATLTGEIVRYDINTNGTLANDLVINTIVNAEGGARAVIGLTFDPAATASNLILWVTHANPTLEGAPEWTSKLAKLTGSNLGTLQTVLINLPRSIRDHLTNSIAFRPGEPTSLYISQGSTSAMGAPDNAWGLRPERLLTAAVLKLDTTKLGALPLNVQTESGGTYNPYAPNAPLTLFATGVRNAYDLVWHSNGELYLPTNGSAAGGNAPGTPTPLPSTCANRSDGPYNGPAVPAINNVGTESDYLFRVVSGGYYGHPNPTRCEWVMNGGNPTSGNDPAQRPEYPVGTAPDRNWRGSAFDFGEHYSPNGVLEYKNAFFGNALKGKLIVARYSGGDDLIVLTLDPTTKNVSTAQTGAPGMTGFGDPLDVVENVANGHLYVSEHGAQKITLLRPIAAPTGLPSPWISGDIGAVGPAGSASFANAKFTVLGAGADIYGATDAFHYVRQQRTGDFTFTARVESLGATDPFAKAGVMVRDSLAANAKNAFVMVTPTNGAKFTWRTGAGGNTSVTTSTGKAAPYWVRIQRQGNTFRAFISANGSTFTQLGANTTISMVANVYVGLAVTSHNTTTLTTAVFTDVVGP